MKCIILGVFVACHLGSSAHRDQQSASISCHRFDITSVMAWSKTSPGIYQRQIGENESFIKFIGDRAHGVGREHWSVTSKTGFELIQPLEDDKLASKCREAWAALRYQHPSIASVVEKSILAYEVPDANALEAWTDETFHVHERTLELNDLIAGLRPSRYVTAHLLLSEPALVLHFPHWRTDGYGALLLVEAFLVHLSSAISVDFMAEHVWGKEIDRLIPSVEDALKLPAEATPDVCEKAKKYLATAALLHNTTGLEASVDRASQVLPGGTRGADLVFSAEETDAIREACCKKEYTIEAAIQASCAEVTYLEAAPDARDKPYTSTMRFSLRPYVPPPYNDATYAAAICTAGYLEQVPASNSWTDNALHYTAKYREGVTSELLQTRRQYATECLKALSQTPPPLPAASSEIDVSSVGNAGELVSLRHTNKSGGVVMEVQNMSIGIETLTRQAYCFIWTFRGQLTLRLVYNESFYDALRMERIVKRVREILVQQLGII